MGLLKRVVSQKVEFFLVVGGAGAFNEDPSAPSVILMLLHVLTNQSCSPVGNRTCKVAHGGRV